MCRCRHCAISRPTSWGALKDTPNGINFCQLCYEVISSIRQSPSWKAGSSANAVEKNQLLAHFFWLYGLTCNNHLFFTHPLLHQLFHGFHSLLDDSKKIMNVLTEFKENTPQNLEKTWKCILVILEASKYFLRNILCVILQISRTLQCNFSRLFFPLVRH